MTEAHDALVASTITATVTATRLEAHEKICAERYGDIKDSFTRVHARLDKIMYGLIGLLITMVGWLVVNGVPWKH
jgi:mannose/fructose/N-acetylgalactosamine-specific phosphotransferase system component IID